MASDDLLVRSRAALLDALEALEDHRDSVIVVGAQAIYLRASHAPVNLAEATKDSDLTIDPRTLEDDPLIEAAMTRARFYLDPTSNQPGAWMNPEGIPVDLMVPEDLAGPGGKSARAARLPPHARGALRRARGLEATLVDNEVMEVAALDPDDERRLRVRVAGPAALLVAKAHKLGERADDPGRLVDKDAHDIYRIVIDVDTATLAATLRLLLDDPVSAEASATALNYLETLFADGPEALGSAMAGRAEEGVGEPETVALAVSILVGDLLAAVR